MLSKTKDSYYVDPKGGYGDDMLEQQLVMMREFERNKKQAEPN